MMWQRVSGERHERTTTRTPLSYVCETRDDSLEVHMRTLQGQVASLSYYVVIYQASFAARMALLEDSFLVAKASIIGLSTDMNSVTDGIPSLMDQLVKIKFTQLLLELLQRTDHLVMECSLQARVTEISSAAEVTLYQPLNDTMISWTHIGLRRFR